MIGSKSLGPMEMVMVGGMTHREWGQSSMLVADGVGVGTRMGSIEWVKGGGHCFGVAPNMEQMLLVVEVEASLVVNMTAFLHCRVWKI